MMLSRSLGESVSHHETDWLACGLMAQRRGLFCRRTALAVPLVVLGLLLLAGSVYVSNCVVVARKQVEGLEDRRQFLEARAANLQARWVALTAPDEIRRRAAAELDLDSPQSPDPVLVQVWPEAAAREGLWRRVMARFGGGQTVAAAADPLSATRSRGMVNLLPRAAQAAESR